MEEKDNNEKPPENPPSPEKEPAGGDGASQVPMVALSMEEYDTLQQELEQTRTQSNEYFDGWQRERADFSNYKRQVGS